MNGAQEAAPRAMPLRVAKFTEVSLWLGWDRLTVNDAVRDPCRSSDTEMLLIAIDGGPSSFRIVPTAVHVPSRHCAPLTEVSDTKMCWLGSIAVSPQIATVTVAVVAPGGIEKGTLDSPMKSTPAVHAAPAVAGLNPAPVNGIAESWPVTGTL